MINMNCALWYINCRGIKVASKSLSDDFKAVRLTIIYKLKTLKLGHTIKFISRN